MIKLEIDDETYTEEEFQRDLKRYFDTLDKDQYPCKFYEECEKCMFFKHSVCGKNYVRAVPINYSFKIMEKVYRWAKEHPVMTNREKLREVFNVNLDKDTELYLSYYAGQRIKFDLTVEDRWVNQPINKWLDAEYKEPGRDK